MNRIGSRPKSLNHGDYGAHGERQERSKSKAKAFDHGGHGEIRINDTGIPPLLEGGIGGICKSKIIHHGAHREHREKQEQKAQRGTEQKQTRFSQNAKSAEKDTVKSKFVLPRNTENTKKDRSKS